MSIIQRISAKIHADMGFICRELGMHHVLPRGKTMNFEGRVARHGGIDGEQFNAWVRGLKSYQLWQSDWDSIDDDCDQSNLAYNGFTEYLSMVKPNPIEDMIAKGYKGTPNQPYIGVYNYLASDAMWKHWYSFKDWANRNGMVVDTNAIQIVGAAVAWFATYYNPEAQ
jgi:hypothetical protein